jgi:Alginate export
MRILILIQALLVSVNCFSQYESVFKPLRYDEDYTFLFNDSAGNWYNHLKFKPVSKDGKTYLSIGGELRYQYFWFKNEAWGEDPADPDGFILTRYLAQVDFHAGKYFRAFVQFQSSFANGEVKTPSPVDENELDFHQGFVDFRLPLQKKGELILRIGRQEFAFGSQRLVAVRDGPNNRQSFDAAKLIYNGRNVSSNLFYSYYVVSKTGIFNDGFNPNTKFWGIYTVVNKVPVFRNIDFYYLGLWKANSKFDDGTGKELRHSVGARIWGINNWWQYDFEAVYQFGKFANSTISAWTASYNISYIFFHSLFKPQFGLKTELISGDKNYGDGRLNTFNPLFPRGSYFGLAALIGPSNLADIHPYTEFQLFRNLSWQTDYDLFWRMSINDGLYGPNTIMIYSGKKTTSKEIGKQLGNAIVFTPNAFLYFRAEFTWFNAGEYLKQVGPGKDILMTVGTIQFRF